MILFTEGRIARLQQTRNLAKKIVGKLLDEEWEEG